MTWHSRAQQYEKSLWQTEWGNWWDAGWPAYNPFKLAISYARKIHEALKIMYANTWVMWEPRFIFDEETKGLVPRKAYWAVAHYSRHVRPGMQMVESVDSVSDCKTTVWVDTNDSPQGGNLTIVTLNDSTKDYRVEYDMSGFDGAEVLEVHQTLLSVSDRNYVSVPFDQISDDKFTLDIPAEAIVTISAKMLIATSP